MLVYRLEKNGFGPFCNHDEQVDRLMYHARDLADNCWPRKPFAPKDYFYCCSSITQLKCWFSSFTLEEFLKIGFTVKVYEVEEQYTDSDTEQVTVQLSKAFIVENITDYQRILDIYETEDIQTEDWMTAIRQLFL